MPQSGRSRNAFSVPPGPGFRDDAKGEESRVVAAARSAAAEWAGKRPPPAPQLGARAGRLVEPETRAGGRVSGSVLPRAVLAYRRDGSWPPGVRGRSGRLGRARRLPSKLH